MSLRKFSRPFFLHRSRQDRELGSVRLWVRSPQRRRLQRGLMLLILAAGFGATSSLLLVSLRWGAQLMINPDAALPPILRFGSQPSEQLQTKTLADLEQMAAAAGERLGVPLAAGQGYQLWPIHSAQSDAIVALRAYQEVGRDRVRRLAQLTVDAPKEAEVLLPLQNTSQPPRLRQRPLALTRLVALNRQGWFTLEGEWQGSGLSLRHGQVIHFSSDPLSLTVQLSWSSPNHERPRWIDLDGEAPPDLIVDKTAGLDPALNGFRGLDQPSFSGQRLESISLVTTPVQTEMDAYRQALALARAGLWADALQQLNALKTRIQAWPPAAEAQLRLVEHHASRTLQQADQTWSTPSQQILAELMDGRWQAALTTLEANPQSFEPLMRSLSQDNGRVWNRVAGILRLEPQNSAALLWSGLILQAQQSSQTALAWLEQRQASETVRHRFQAVLTLGDPSLSPSTPPAAVPASNDGATIQFKPFTAMVGAAEPLTQLELDDWRWPEGSPFLLPPGQTWYAVRLLAVRQGNRWEPPGNLDAARVIEALGKRQNPLQLLLSTNSSRSIPLTIQAGQSQADSLVLLARGPADPPISPVALAYSPNSLVWLSSDTGFSPRNEGPLQAALQQIVQPQAPISEPLDLGPVLAEATYYPLILEGSEEHVLILERSALDALEALGVKGDRNGPKTLIFSAEGDIRYSNLFTAETLIAITHPGDQAAHLLVRSAGGYEMRRLELESVANAHP